VRALAYLQPAALEWLDRIERGELEAAWPTLLYAEVANGLLELHRSQRLSVRDARAVLDAAVAIPARTASLEILIGPAWSLALERRLSAYDACYVVLAETLDAPLVTADRRLAAATANAVLISG
jgi:predicted nucleic acid-binding protein